MHKNQHGSLGVGVLLLVIFLGVAGYAGYRVMNNRSDSADKQTNQQAREHAKELKITVKEKGVKILPNGHADPTIAKTETGFRMYVNRQSGGPSGYLTFTSEDGVTWQQENDIVIPHVSTGRAVIFPDGIRVYYPGPQPIKPSDPQADMLSSFSTDGVSFTKDDGVRLQPQNKDYYLEGPTVFQLEDKTWRMYFNENTIAAGMQRDGIIWGASSTDGLTWTRDQKPTITFDETEASLGKSKAPWDQVLHPFVVKNPKGGYIMFYNSHSEIFAATSPDGTTWNKIGQIGIHGADADGYFQEDGTFRLFYGDWSQETGGLVYSAVLEIQ